MRRSADTAMTILEIGFSFFMMYSLEEPHPSPCDGTEMRGTQPVIIRCANYQHQRFLALQFFR